MNKIIKSEPAPYPPTNTPEINAVIEFVSILNRERVKPDVNFLDKIPNTDGIVELVTENQIPIGKIDVQIKYLKDKNHKQPKYQCTDKFLAFCESSILPVILIVVDIKKSIAYWHHIDKQTIIDLGNTLGKKGTESVNLDFETDKKITKDDLQYIDDWINIIESYQEKLYDYDELKQRTVSLDSELKEIKELSNDAVGKTDPIFKEIHTFLDFYNGLLDNDFLTIKNKLYPNYWKIGLGYHSYFDSKVNFVLYPIRYDVNDVLIKQYQDEKQYYTYLQNIRYIGHNRENPIKSRPREYAYELIEKDTFEVVGKKPLLVKDSFLSEEYIFAFIDEFHLLLGLKPLASMYSIKDIEKSLNTFLPLWIESSINKDSYKKELPPLLFMMDYVFYHRSEKDIIKISDIVKQKLSKGEKPTLNIKISSDNFSINILYSLINYMKQIGIENIEREYEVKNSISKRMYFLWEAWGEEKTVNNVNIFYSHFPRIYDLLVKTYFPNLFNELQFFNEFNLLLITVDFNKTNYTHTPSIQYFKLQSPSEKENKIVVYNANDENNPFKNKGLKALFQEDIKIDNNEYKIVGWSSSIIDFIYEDTPILKSINSLIKQRLELYFENEKKK